MTPVALVLILAGFSLLGWFREGEFAGSTEDAARRATFRKFGIGMLIVGVALLAWIEYA